MAGCNPVWSGSFLALLSLSACAAPSGTVTSVVPAQGAVVSGTVSVISKGTISLATGDPTTKFGLITGSNLSSGTLCSIYQELYLTSGPPSTYSQAVAYDSKQFQNTSGYSAYGGIQTVNGTPPNTQNTVLSYMSNTYSIQNNPGTSYY